jgi:hypothetical protein
LATGPCLRGEHDLCSHLAGPVSVNLWRFRRGDELTFTLCACGCHADCPLAGRRTVTSEDWQRLCTCPGSAAAKDQQQRREQRRRDVVAVYEQARAEGLRDADQLESRLRAVFLADGEEPPAGLATASRIASAAQSPRGTRTGRVAWLAVRAAVATGRWAWQPPTSDLDAHNRAEARRMYRATGTTAGIAALLTTMAVLSSGRRRAAWSAGAAAAWGVATVGFTVGTGVMTLARSIAERSGPGDR